LSRCFTRSWTDEGTTLNVDSSAAQSQGDRRQSLGKNNYNCVVLRSFTDRTYIQPISRHHFTCLRFADPVQNPSRHYGALYYYFYSDVSSKTTTLTTACIRRCVFAPWIREMLETYCTSMHKKDETSQKYKIVYFEINYLLSKFFKVKSHSKRMKSYFKKRAKICHSYSTMVF